MAKKIQPVIIDQIPTELIVSKDEFNKVLDERITIGSEIFLRRIPNIESFKKNREDFSNWNDYNSEYLKHVFNKESNEYKKRYDESGLFSYSIIARQSSPAEELKKFKAKVSSKLDNLQKLRACLLYTSRCV